VSVQRKVFPRATRKKPSIDLSCREEKRVFSNLKRTKGGSTWKARSSHPRFFEEGRKTEKKPKTACPPPERDCGIYKVGDPSDYVQMKLNLFLRGKEAGGLSRNPFYFSQKKERMKEGGGQQFGRGEKGLVFALSSLK